MKDVWKILKKKTRSLKKKKSYKKIKNYPFFS